MGKKTVLDFLDMKGRREKITFLTAYDYPLASFAEKAGIDMMLVGDSLGMVVYGLPGTIPVTMDEMIIHSRAVRRGAPGTFVIGDMPFMSYQSSAEKAVENAGRFLKEAEMDAIKLEGGRRVEEQIKAIVEAGIPVMGHIGLTPQSSGQLGGFKAQGRTAEAARELMLDAIAIEEAGAFSILELHTISLVTKDFPAILVLSNESSCITLFDEPLNVSQVRRIHLLQANH